MSSLKRTLHEPVSTQAGKIQIIFGPMFSGKTTELLRRIKRYQYANYRCLLIRYAKDDRYDTEQVATHDQQKMQAVSAVELGKVTHSTRDIDVIGIDEGQFFPDIVSFCEIMADNRKIVLVAALDGTYQRTGFGNILNLVPLAESVEKLTAVCMSCFKEAAFTRRTGQETEVEVIGGCEKYMSVCRECYKLKTIIKGSPFKVPDEQNENVAKNVQEKKRKLFDSLAGQKEKNSVPTKSAKQTQV